MTFVFCDAKPSRTVSLRAVEQIPGYDFFILFWKPVAEAGAAYYTADGRRWWGGGDGLALSRVWEQTNLHPLTADLAACLPLSMDGWRGVEETWIVVAWTAAPHQGLAMI